MTSGNCTLGTWLTRVRECCPLVHHITNIVTVSECANVVKCLGASPVMTAAEDEAADMTCLADALVLNIGTLTPGQLSCMLRAGEAAAEKGLPIVLDVCGAGATPFRDSACARLLDALPVTIVKGNASEVAAVAGKSVVTRGVDAGEVEVDLDDVVSQLARSRSGVVAMTGPVDRVADGRSVVHVDNGHGWLSRVVGTGCMVTSVIGAFAGVTPDPMEAAVAGLAWFGVAAEHAAAIHEEAWACRNGLYTALAGLEPHAHASDIRIIEVA